MPDAPRPFLPSGRFSLGANYWASHAGTSMWADWREDVVARDLDQLGKAGLDVLRVFPLWPNFQPIHRLYGGNATLVGFALADGSPLANRDGLDDVMVDRFRALCRLAGERGIGLIVGLVTGWMSGRLFVPPGLAGLDPTTDAVSLRWQVRLCRGLVERLRGEAAIVAWDLGNECNEMGRAQTRDEAYRWTAAISGAIKAADPSRPLVSGMHSLKVAEPGVWRIQDQGELTDVLTTHPYPFWVPHAGNNPTDTLGPILHATAETRLYADVSGRPAMAEEIGSMGPTVLDDERSADFFRASALSLFAHDGRAALWWCAFDQEKLTHPPYEWVAVERRLGLIRSDGTPKPVLEAMSRVRRFADEIGELPPRVVDAAVVLTPGQDQWAAAFGAFVLAKQAGLDVRFLHAGALCPEGPEALPDPATVPMLIVPSIAGLTAITASLAAKLEAYVAGGGHVLVTVDDAHVPNLAELFGVKLARRYPRPEGQALAITLPHDAAFTSTTRVRMDLAADDAEVLATEADCSPVLTRRRVGRGSASLLTLPIEVELATRPGLMTKAATTPWHGVYRAAFEHAPRRKIARQDQPRVGMTEHVLSDAERLLVLVNAGDAPATCTLTLADGWTATHSTIEVPPFDAATTRLTRR